MAGEGLLLLVVYQLIIINKYNTTMSTIKVTIKSITLFNNNGNSSVRFTTAEQFDGFAQSADRATGEITFTQTKVDHFSLTVPQLVRAANLSMPLVAFYFGGVDTRVLDQKQLRNLFFGSKLTIERELVPARTEYEDAQGNKVVTKRDAYRTEIINIEMNELNQAQAMDLPITAEMILAASKM